MQQQQQYVASGGKTTPSELRNCCTLTIHTMGDRVLVRDGNVTELLKEIFRFKGYFEKIQEVRVSENEIIVRFDDTVNCFDVLWRIYRADFAMAKCLSSILNDDLKKDMLPDVYAATCSYGRFVSVSVDKVTGLKEVIEELKKHGVVLEIWSMLCVNKLCFGSTIVSMFVRNHSWLLDDECMVAKWGRKVQTKPFDPRCTVTNHFADKVNVLWERFGWPAFDKAAAAAGLCLLSWLFATPVTHAAVEDVAAFGDYERALPEIAKLSSGNK